jgi:hypothetical protein
MVCCALGGVRPQSQTRKQKKKNIKHRYTVSALDAYILAIFQAM